MHRLIVLILAAVDAATAAAVGIAATLAPLTLLWVLGMGGAADWGALWPATAAIWQLGNLVPLQVALPGDYLAVSGIDPAAGSFVLSLAPLALAGFTAIFAARSGVRASRAEAWGTGVITGTGVFAALATAVALTSANRLAETQLWQAILFPSLVFAVPLLIGAFTTEWLEAGAGWVARVRDRVEAAPRGWGDVPGLAVRGASVVLAGLIGLGALVFAVALLLRGGEVIALFEAAHVDALGATVVTLAQLAYLPTLAIWGMAFVAGPGFAVGAGTAVSPAGTQLGVTPGIPVLGALPESTTPWLLLLALLPVALGALAGWIARSRLVAPAAFAEAPTGHVPVEWDAGAEAARSSALTALLAGVDATRPAEAAVQDSDPAPAARDGREGPERIDPAEKADAAEPIAARAAIALGIAVLSATGAAVLALLASGSIGPQRLAEVGPQPGPVALAVGLEVLLGAGILLLSPRRRPRAAVEGVPQAEPSLEHSFPLGIREKPVTVPAVGFADAEDTPLPPAADDATSSGTATLPPRAPDPGAPDPGAAPKADLGRRRPTPLPPVD